MENEINPSPITGLVPRKDAAKILNMSLRWLADRQADGTGPKYYKISGRVKYAVADLQAWLAAQQKI
jgi:hypothetical protein